MPSVSPLFFPTPAQSGIVSVVSGTSLLDCPPSVRVVPSTPDTLTVDRRSPGTLVGIADLDMRSELAAHLAAEGFTVWQAGSGRETLSTFLDHTGDLDVLVLDAGFSDLPGRVFLTRLRANFPGVPCVFLADPRQAAALAGLGVWTVSPALGPAAVVAAVREVIAASDSIVFD